MEHIRCRVLELIRKHEPDKIDCIDVLMRKWRKKEGDLLKALCTKYKEEYRAMPPIEIQKVYAAGTRIATGTFGFVRKCRRRADGMDFAVKVIETETRDKECMDLLENEVNITRQASHPNIVQFHDVFDCKDKMCLVLELLTGGSLYDRIIEDGPFGEEAVATIFRQIMEALSYLHENGIVHRDLKPEEVLFVSKAKDSKIKLIDFGLSGSVKGGLLKTALGTPHYVAPEILKRMKYGTKVDMWSSGVILYVLLCGFPPFYDEEDNLGKLYRQIKEAKYEFPSPYWDDVGDHGMYRLETSFIVIFCSCIQRGIWCRNCWSLILESDCRQSRLWSIYFCFQNIEGWC